MCLGIPGQIVKRDGNKAVVDFWGIRKEVRLDMLEVPVAVGDFIISHCGAAIRRIPDDEIVDTIALYDTILAEAGEDPIGRDISLELEEAALVPA